METKLEAFRALLEADTRRRYQQDRERDQKRGNDWPLSVHEPQMVCCIKMGRKYANVDVGSSGRYMVELSTGAIYGIKGYGVIHRGHYYGTLDTVNDYEWGEYTAIKRNSKTA